MSTWYLIILLTNTGAQGGVAIHHVEFHSAQYCMIAAKTIEESKKRGWGILAFCVEQD